MIKFVRFHGRYQWEIAALHGLYAAVGDYCTHKMKHNIIFSMFLTWIRVQPGRKVKRIDYHNNILHMYVSEYISIIIIIIIMTCEYTCGNVSVAVRETGAAGNTVFLRGDGSAVIIFFRLFFFSSVLFCFVHNIRCNFFFLRDIIDVRLRSHYQETRVYNNIVIVFISYLNYKTLIMRAIIHFDPCAAALFAHSEILSFRGCTPASNVER